MRALATIAIAASVAAIKIRNEVQVMKLPTTPGEIFDHCDANENGWLTVHEGLNCVTNFVKGVFKPHWPKNGRAVNKAEFEEIAKAVHLDLMKK